MIAAINPTNLHDLTKIIHVAISVAFTIFAILVITRSSIGLIQHKVYTKLDRYLSYAFIISLYLQVILGILLFSNLGALSGFDYLDAESGGRIVSKRLWPIEHIVTMIFAVLIASLGLLLSINARIDKDKHRKVLIYFAIAILLIGQSLFAIYVL